MISKSYIHAFIPEGKSDKHCGSCGKCLQKCPVMKMGKEAAVGIIIIAHGNFNHRQKSP